MQLGEPDASGRCRPLPIEGSEYTLDIDLAVIAVGNGTNPLLRSTPGLEFTQKNTLMVDGETLQTSKKGVFAGGDIVTGGATVISAMGAGRKAALSIDAYLEDKAR
jgi:glutamate synthase (NADPH/NADH) small chain